LLSFCSFALFSWQQAEAFPSSIQMNTSPQTKMITIISGLGLRCSLLSQNLELVREIAGSVSTKGG